MDRGLAFALSLCGLSTASQRTRFVNQSGLSKLSDFLLFEAEDLNKVVSQLSKRQNDSERLRVTQLQVKKLIGVGLWVRDKKRRGQDLDHNELDDQLILDLLEKKRFKDQESESGSVDSPPSFEPVNWVKWHILFCNYMRSLSGVTDIPLYYVIRKEKTPDEILVMDETDQLIYQASLCGNAFKFDKKRVYTILKQFLANTDAWQWIQAHDESQDGRMAMKALRDHYDGPGSKMKRLANANQSISTLHYTQEHTFSFEKYITKLKGAFNILKDNEEPKTEREKVRLMLQKIQSNNVQIQSAISTIAMDDSLNSNFDLACNKLSERIAIIFPSSATGRQRYRTTSATNSGSRFHKRGNRGRGSGRGPRGGRGTSFNDSYNKIVNGVDISNLTRKFTSDEYTKLPGWV